MIDPVGSLYAEVGEPRLRAMVAGFYARVPADDLLGPMYPTEDMAGAEERLAGFIIFRFGGPADYVKERGHPRLRMRHMPFAIGAPEAERWLLLMAAAMEEAGISGDPAQRMVSFFTDVAASMRNR